MSVATMPHRVAGYVRCHYCGLWHEADEDGVIQGMCAAERKARKAAPVQQISNEEYHSRPGLSNSGLSHLLVSPLRFWYHVINPNRPAEEVTSFMDFGSALHTAVLEPDDFEKRYCQRLDAEDIAGVLVTMADLREWASENGFKAKGTRKDEVIDQLRAVDPNVPIFDVLKAEHDKENEGKTQFKKEDWFRIGGAAQALRQEPKLQEILSDDFGQSEQSFFVEFDGVPLKARMDWVTGNHTLDIKTITAKRGQPFDKSVTNAIWYEGYHRQAYFYAMVRALARGDTERDGPQVSPPHVIAFVESEPPHEVRLRTLDPRAGGEVNMLWERARIDIESGVALYREYWKEFGEKRWRYAQQRETLCDEEFPALAYS